MKKKKIEIDMAIYESVRKEMVDDMLQKQRLNDLNNFFNNFDSKINKVGELIDKVPENSNYNPPKSWLEKFGF